MTESKLYIILEEYYYSRDLTILYAIDSTKDPKEDLKEFEETYKKWENLRADYIQAFPGKAPVPPAYTPDDTLTYFKSREYLNFYDAQQKYFQDRADYYAKFNTPAPKSRDFLEEKGYKTVDIQERYVRG